MPSALHDALEIAIAAAHAAGRLLHAEFHRPGGPRGQGDHAEVDAEAEAVIRATLLERFPTWSYLGEELGARAGSDPDHVWLVDPHDGTRAFLEGHRGTTVAIGLLRGGVPVLGVVLVHTSASGAPELFAWAEGCGPLEHEGAAITRASFAEELHGEQTILVSQAADRREHASRANAALCWPARFRGLASLAHRMARVAVGEAEVAVALHRPSAWDLVAGHALLRAVGGELFDERGEVVRYAPDGTTRVEHAFAGAPVLARELAGRDWSRVHEPGNGDPHPFELLRPIPGRAIADAGVLERARGCLFGQLAGDSLGSLVEFAEARAIARMYPQGVRRLADGGAFDTIAGQPTDDSELALMLARSLVAEQRFDDEAVARSYAAWCASGPFDIGTTTSNALRPANAAAREGRSAAAVARAAALTNAMGSQANGALMRISPLGIFGWRMPAHELAELARRDAWLTHPNPVCRDASALFVVMIAHAIATGPSPHQLHAFAASWAKRASLHPDVLAIVRESVERPPDEYHARMGWVRIALGNALHQLAHARDFESGVVDTVMRGGDTDTNAAIAGALLGAVHGCAAVPRQWRDRVQTCRPIAGLLGVKQPRPRMFWPVDADVMAERLLLASS
jgi:ADP-ribosyl-[dinitrogen reductase] hydrolase